MIKNLVWDSIGLEGDCDDRVVPSRLMSRDEWQRAVEVTLQRMRIVDNKPALGISEAEISVSYHLPIARFMLLLRDKKGA